MATAALLKICSCCDSIAQMNIHFRFERVKKKRREEEKKSSQLPQCDCVNFQIASHIAFFSINFWLFVSLLLLHSLGSGSGHVVQYNYVYAFQFLTATHPHCIADIRQMAAAKQNKMHGGEK